MNFGTWQDVAMTAFVFGIVAGVVLCAVVAAAALKFGLNRNFSEAAKIISENAYLRAREETSRERVAASQRILDDLGAIAEAKKGGVN